MKNYTIILVVTGTLFLFSCKKDDGIINPDPIIGQWIIKSVLVDNEVNALNACELNSIFQFFEDKTWRFAEFDNNTDSTGCMIGTSSNSGTWENAGQDTYNLTPESGMTFNMAANFTNGANTLTTIIEEEVIRVFTYNRLDNQDPIIGKWNLVGVTYNDISEEVDACRMRTFLEFFANNIVIGSQYGLNSEETECVLEEESFATWQNSGNGVYTSDEGNTGIESIMVSFSNDNNTLTFTIEAIISDLPVTIVRTYDRVMN